MYSLLWASIPPPHSMDMKTPFMSMCPFSSYGQVSPFPICACDPLWICGLPRYKHVFPIIGQHSPPSMDCISPMGMHPPHGNVVSK